MRNLLIRSSQLAVSITPGLSSSVGNSFTPESVSWVFYIFESAIRWIDYSPARLYRSDQIESLFLNESMKFQHARQMDMELQSPLRSSVRDNQ